MSSKPDDPPPLVHRHSDAAPVVFFDTAPVFGVYGGAVHVELFVRFLKPSGVDTIAEMVSAAHLRCSPAAAVALIGSLQQALELLQPPQQTDAAKLN